MNKFKYSQDVYVVATGEKTRVKSVITNHSKKASIYLLDNGKTVNEDQIVSSLVIEETKPTKKKKVKQEVVEVIEDVKEDPIPVFNDIKEEEIKIDFKELNKE